MDLGELASALIQAGMGLAAWRLANALKIRVDNHEQRLTVIETDISRVAHNSVHSLR